MKGPEQDSSPISLDPERSPRIREGSLPARPKRKATTEERGPGLKCPKQVSPALPAPPTLPMPEIPHSNRFRSTTVCKVHLFPEPLFTRSSSAQRLQSLSLRAEGFIDWRLSFCFSCVRRRNSDCVTFTSQCWFMRLQWLHLPQRR